MTKTKNITFRGTSVKGIEVIGNLVVTNRFIKHKPKSHTKTWIIETSFGNGGWFNILKRTYVKPDTVEVYSGLGFDLEELWDKVEIV